MKSRKGKRLNGGRVGLLILEWVFMANPLNGKDHQPIDTSGKHFGISKLDNFLMGVLEQPNFINLESLKV